MDKQQLAERARALLSDEILAEALASVERRAVDALTSCDPANVDGLQAAALELRAVRAVENAIRAHIDTYAIEQKKGRHRGQHD